MSLTFAGIDLLPKTEELSNIIERWISSNRPELFTHQGYSLERMHHVAIPDRPKQEFVRYGTLRWPKGASRYATFHCFLSGPDDIASIQSLINTDSPVPQNLVFEDDVTGNTVTASMFVLAFNPVFVQDGKYDLWEIVLVDSRYYFWTRELTYTFTAGDSWATLLSNLVQAASGTTPTVPSIPAAYGSPQPLRWSLANKPLPLIIDAAAKQVGLQLVTTPGSSTISFVNATTAISNSNTQFNTYEGELGIGGKVDVSTICGVVPASVAVAFWGDVATIQTTTLASLSLSQFGSLTGVSNTYGWIQSDFDASASTSAKNNYVTQAATDYYKWALSLVDCTFRGVIPWTPTGMEDCVEWEWMPGQRDYISKKYSIETDTGNDSEGNSFLTSARLVDDSLNARVHSNKSLPWNRIATRIIRSDFADRNIYGDRPPPGYSYNVKLTGSGTSTGGFTAWSGNIQITTNSGGVIDGPPLGWGGNNYVALPVTGTTPAIGNYVTVVPDPFIPDVWTFTNGGGNSSTSCGGCGWLVDIPIDGFNTPILTLTFTGKGTGRCNCIDTGQSSVNMYYDYDSGQWITAGHVYTCCGCGYASFLLTGATTASLSFNSINWSCVGLGSGTGTPYTLSLVQECCFGTCVQYRGSGADSCNSPVKPCDNTFTVTVCCNTCASQLLFLPCTYCLEQQIPELWIIDTSKGTPTGQPTTFGDPYGAYNGKWYLYGGCTKTTDICNNIKVTMSMAVVATGGVCQTQVTITFSGSPAGSVVYTYTTTNLYCYQGIVLTKNSGYPPAVPSSMYTKPITCGTPPTISGLKVTTSTTICGILALTNQSMFNEMGSTGDGYLWEYSAGGGNGSGMDTAKGFGLFAQIQPDGTFNIYPYCQTAPPGSGCGYACYSGPPTIIGLINMATLPDVLISFSYICNDPSCTDCSPAVTNTITIKNF